MARLQAEIAGLKKQLREAKVVATVGPKRNASVRAARVRVPSSAPHLPTPDESGHYPAVEFAYASLARTIIARRKAARWSQAELATRAGVRTETINRLESGRHSPNVRTIDRIDTALKRAGV